MAESKTLPYLVSYDIRCPKRLGRVFRLLKKSGIHVQYSVFLLELDRREVISLLAYLDNMIAAEDDVRVYTLPKKPSWCSFGRATLADGIMLNGSLGFVVQAGKQR